MAKDDIYRKDKKYNLPYDIGKYDYIKDDDKFYVVSKDGSFGREINKLDYLKYLHNIGDTTITIKPQDNKVLAQEEFLDDGPDAIFYKEGGVVESGKIKGPGNGKSDSILSSFPAGTLIVPIEKTKLAQEIYKKYIGKKVKEVDFFNGGSLVKTSNGEFVFSPEDIELIQSKGGDITPLLPEKMQSAKDGAVVEEDFNLLFEGLGSSSEEVDSELSALDDLDAEFIKESSLKKKGPSETSFIGSPIISKASPFQPPGLVSKQDFSTSKSEDTPSESESFEFKFSKPTEVKKPKTITTTTSGEGVVEVEPSKEKTYTQEVIDAIGVGSARLGSSIAKTPSLIYQIASIPQNKIAEYTGLNISTSPEEFGKTIGLPENEVANYFDNIISKTQEGISKKYDKGISDYFFGDNKDYEKGFKLLGLQVAESAPISMSLALGNAAGMSALETTLGGGAIFAADKLSEIEKSGADLSQIEKIGIATSNGILEGLFENIGITKLGGIAKDLILKEGKDKAKDIIQDGFIKTYLPIAKKYLGIGAEESISEAATQFSQNAVDKYSGYKPDIELLDGVTDAAIVGGVAGNSFAFTPATIEIYNTSKSRKEASELISQKIAIESDINNPNIPIDVKSELANSSLNINERLVDLQKEDSKEFSKLPKEEQEEVVSLNTRLSNIEKAILQEGVSDKSKEVLENEKAVIKERINSIETIKPKEDAIQIESPTEVLQRQQEEVRVEGSERERVEPIKQGEEVANKSKEKEIVKLPKRAEDLMVEENFTPSTPDELYNYVSIKSEDPIEIYTTYKQAVPETKRSYKEQIIDENLSKVNKSSYNRFGDPNKVTMAMAKRFFTTDKSASKSLDTIAQELSENAGIEITPSDIVEYMESYSYEKKISDSQRKLMNRFTEITGMPFSEKSINEIYKKEAQKYKQDLDKILNEEATDYESAVEYYENKIRSGEIPIEELEQVSSIGGDQKVKEKEVKLEPENLIENEDELRKSVSSSLSRKESLINSVLGDSPISPSDINKESSSIVKSKIIPIREVVSSLFKFSSKLQDKVLDENVNKAKDWISNKIKEGNISQNKAKRWTSQFLTSWFNAMPRTKKDLENKRLMRGNINLSKEKFLESKSKLYSLIGNDIEGLERVHQVLDPDFYKDNGVLFEDKITYDKLTDNEKSLYNLLRDINDYLHDWNFSMGLIGIKEYLENKGKYIARLYDPIEMPSNTKEFLEQNEIPLNNGNIKVLTEIFKARTEIDEWKKNNIIRDPVYLTLKRMMQTEVNASVLSYIDYVSKQKGLVSKEPKDGFTQLNGKGYGKLNGLYVPNYIAEDFQGYFFGNQLADLIYDVTKVYDRNKIRQFLKKYHTIFNPAVQLGNITSNYVFSFLSGIDPLTFSKYYGGGGSIAYASGKEITKSPAYKELENKGDIYKLLVKNNILGTDIITGDLRPLTEKTEEFLNDEKTKSKLSKVTEFIDKKSSELYSLSDDMAKMAAFMSYKDYGYSDSKAIEKVYDSFQNYSSVGKLWDISSKLLVFGNPYVKFKADLQRILVNAVQKRPLNTAAFLSLLYAISVLTSKLFGETEEEKKIREGRRFIPKINIGGFEIPLVFMTPFGEINLARYISPLYSYDTGDNESVLEQFFRFTPLDVKKVEGKNKGDEDVFFPKNDPFLGVWVSAIIDDLDFREKSIQDPSSTKFRRSGISSTEKALNASNYILRSQAPLYPSVQDMYLSLKYGKDFYGRRKKLKHVLLNQFIKIEDIKDVDYRRFAEDKINEVERKADDLENKFKEAESSYEKNIERIQEDFSDKNITKEQMDRSLSKELKSLQSIQANILEDIAEVQSNINELNKQRLNIR